MKKYLLVIDMQNDFIDGSLGTPEAVAIVGNVVEKIKQYIADPDGDVYATRDTHQPDYLQTQEGKNLPVEHCIKGTEGWALRPEIAAGGALYQRYGRMGTSPGDRGTDPGRPCLQQTDLWVH